MSRGPRESDRECDRCRVRLRWRRPLGGIFGLVLFGTLFLVFLAAYEFVGVIAGVGTPFVAFALALVFVGELGLFVALGGAGLLFRPWEICPRCTDFRLPGDRYRRLVRIERIFGPLRWYLLVPVVFIALFRRGDVGLILALILGVLGAQLLLFTRPRRWLLPNEPRGTLQTGNRIPEDEDE